MTAEAACINLPDVNSEFDWLWRQFRLTQTHPFIRITIAIVHITIIIGSLALKPLTRLSLLYRVIQTASLRYLAEIFNELSAGLSCPEERRPLVSGSLVFGAQVLHARVALLLLKHLKVRPLYWSSGQLGYLKN